MHQEQLGNTRWKIADDLRRAINADDFREYDLSFLFLRSLSDNYETAAKKELRRDHQEVGGDTRKVPLVFGMQITWTTSRRSRNKFAARFITLPSLSHHISETASPIEPASRASSR